MARNGSGTYVVPNTFSAGQVIAASAENENFSDAGSEITNSLPRDGQAGMTGQFKATSGTAPLPSITFTSDPTTGFYRKSSGVIGIAVSGAEVGSISSAGLTITGVTPIGAGMDYWGTTAPTGWIFPYGQAVSRTTYALLFAAIGTTYGIGDGTTTFNLPDKRDKASFAKGDMGGVDAALITNAINGFSGAALGAVGGFEARAITQAELPGVSPTFSGSFTGTAGTFSLNLGGNTMLVESGIAINTGTSGAHGGLQYVSPTVTVTPVGTISGTISALGSGTTHPHMPPTIICNYIIFAGV